MSSALPICDQIAREMVSKLSEDTKYRMYQDLKDEYPDQARDILEAGSIEEALNEFAFFVFWTTQHQLMRGMNMTDEEIEARVYNNG